jgi:hypothetical protein
MKECFARSTVATLSRSSIAGKKSQAHASPGSIVRRGRERTQHQRPAPGPASRGNLKAARMIDATADRAHCRSSFMKLLNLSETIRATAATAIESDQLLPVHNRRKYFPKQAYLPSAQVVSEHRLRVSRLTQTRFSPAPCYS